MRINFKILVSLAVFVLLYACKKETTWDVDASVPIARSHLNVTNFFSDTIFKPDNTGLVH
jgi:hypothetical protein